MIWDLIESIKPTRRSMKNVGRAYHTQAKELIRLCRLLMEQPNKDFSHITESEALKHVLDHAAEAIRCAVGTAGGGSIGATVAFDSATESLIAYVDVHAAEYKAQLGGNIHGQMEFARQTDQTSLANYRSLRSKLRLRTTFPCTVQVMPQKKLVRVVCSVWKTLPIANAKPPWIPVLITTELDPMANFSELLWMLSCRVEESSRVSLKDNPHFYNELQDDQSPEAYKADFKCNPLQRDMTISQLSRGSSSVVLHILKNRTARIYLTSGVISRTFGNLWKPSTEFILKDVRGLLEAANIIGKSIDVALAVWRRGGSDNPKSPENWNGILEEALGSNTGDWHVHSVSANSNFLPPSPRDWAPVNETARQIALNPPSRAPRNPRRSSSHRTLVPAVHEDRTPPRPTPPSTITTSEQSSEQRSEQSSSTQFLHASTRPYSVSLPSAQFTQGTSSTSSEFSAQNAPYDHSVQGTPPWSSTQASSVQDIGSSPETLIAEHSPDSAYSLPGLTLPGAPGTEAPSQNRAPLPAARTSRVSATPGAPEPSSGECTLQAQTSTPRPLEPHPELSHRLASHVPPGVLVPPDVAMSSYSRQALTHPPSLAHSPLPPQATHPSEAPIAFQQRIHSHAPLPPTPTSEAASSPDPSLREHDKAMSGAPATPPSRAREPAASPPAMARPSPRPSTSNLGQTTASPSPVSATIAATTSTPQPQAPSPPRQSTPTTAPRQHIQTPAPNETSTPAPPKKSWLRRLVSTVLRV